MAKRTEELRKSNAALEMSIARHERAQQALIRTQAELAHLSLFLTMGELTASIAHEVNQPLTAVVTFGNACLEWLSASPPNLEEARQAAETIVKDGNRAAAVLGRIRALFRNQPPSKDWLDMNEAIRELVALLHHEAMQQNISMQIELSRDLPQVRGDRVQLQQVVLNLIMNAIDAMREVTDRPKVIVVRSTREDRSAIRVAVEDCGVGFSLKIAEKIFDPFFTTKAQVSAWDFRLAARLLNRIEGGSGACPARPAVPYFSLQFLLVRRRDRWPRWRISVRRFSWLTTMRRSAML